MPEKALVPKAQDKQAAETEGFVSHTSATVIYHTDQMRLKILG